MQLVGGEKNKGVQVVSEEKNENSEDKREPFWSVGREDRLHFSFVFSLIFFIALISFYFYECYGWDDKAGVGWTKAFFNLLKSFVPIGLFAFTLAFLFFEVRDAVAYLRNKWQNRQKKREKELYDRYYQEGYEAGRKAGIQGTEDE
ncbi:MAG: hypothetical protein OXH16_19995 [Gemmatimonadetes bacterium]|nr:hypothetical protein [Gemmatimonadota bacterium]